MIEETLFPLPETQERAYAPPTRPQNARVLRPVRNQVEMMVRDLDSLVADDHAARAIWSLLEKLDLSVFDGAIKAVWEQPGRPTTDQGPSK